MASSTGDSGYVDNWQTGKTVTECNLHMLTTEDCSDVIFRVGSEKHVVRAHRYVLVSRSCVFHAMFCGPLAEKGEVTIPDIEPNVFREFLRYVYTDIADITAENVSGLLYTSRKYAVDALMSECTNYLEKSLTEENVCQILEQSHGYRELDLERKALKILTEAGETVTKSSGFLNLCSDCLGKLLKSDQLRMKEEQIFEATLSWTKQACQKENVPVTHENLRKLLGEMVYEIRFYSMSLDYLVNVVGQSDVLSDSERVRIMDKALRPSVDISPFKSTPRKRIQPTLTASCLPNQYVHRFQGEPAWCISPGTHTISLSVTGNIHLVGCQLYGPYKEPCQSRIGIKVINVDDNVTLQSFTRVLTLQGGAQLNSFMFPIAILLNADCTYSLSVTISRGTSIWCGTRGQQHVNVDGVTFIFTDLSESENETSVTQGQIPVLIFRQIKLMSHKLLPE